MHLPLVSADSHPKGPEDADGTAGAQGQLEVWKAGPWVDSRLCRTATIHSRVRGLAPPVTHTQQRDSQLV